MYCGFERILTFRNPMTTQPLRFLSMTGVDNTTKYQYSWSVDNVCWTSWTTYDNYLRLSKNCDTDFWLRVLVNDTIGEVQINGLTTTCYDTCIMPEMFGKDFCSDPNLMDPYANLDCALLLQQQAADMIICMFGIPVYYFRCDPVKESADYTFKEFTMHNVVDCKMLKLMLQDGQMPSSNYKLGDLDFDWEVDWETELSKTQFATAFGDTAVPKDNDFIYVPMMKRMWMVNSAYDEKNEGLMYRSTTWKLALVKYEDAMNIDKGNWEDVVDTFLGKKYEDTFQPLEDNERARETAAPQLQAPRFAATNMEDVFISDAIRKSMTKKDIRIIDKIYCHHNNVVARNIYKFNNENGCVVYQKGFCGEEGTITFIVETQGTMHGQGTKPIAEFGPIVFEMGYMNDKFIFGVENMVAELDQFQTYLITYRWSKKNFTRELNIYSHTRRTDMPVYMLKPESFWFDIENPIFSCTEAYNEDYITKKEQQCQVHGYPLLMTNIKLYNRYLADTDVLEEALKYTTTNNACVFNDLARQITTGQGYSVK